MLEHIDFDTIDGIECQRLFHGRGHAYPGLEHVSVDYFPPLALITLYQEESAQWLDENAHGLMTSIQGCRSVKVQYRCRPRAPFEQLLGDEIEQLNAIEHGLKYHLNFSQNQNFGLFLDMRNGRQWVMENSQDRNVLNLFAYTCAFSVASIAGGGKQAVNIDIAKAALAKGRDNHRLNDHQLSKVKFEGVDIFKSWARLKKHGPYDLLIADPPSFQKGSIDVKRDYPKIIKRLPELMNPGAELMLCLNSPDLGEDFIFEMIAEHCPQCQFIGRVEPPQVFKEAQAGKGLKVLLFRYPS
ncbi:methyltransferase domain-containing protein [Thalassotalea sp. HSM 43]|uniref:class I SAM-dependent methyltransferase n=1 Tax=Thalassotalea sp. HSM 43 TaxID=2552945 RepID=UPI0010818E14|nr:class I SAM-dependent methyltransferase [Thalassotalea sp. HSM 43]QBY03754.1 methyltransferase domain-containing protein [Thalassotalea sp. HSM 43]